MESKESKIILRTTFIKQRAIDFVSRQIRKVEGDLRIVRAETNLTDDQLATVMEVAESLDFMTDPDKFTPHFQEKMTYFGNAPMPYWRIWEAAANSAIEDELVIRGIQDEAITSEFRSIVGTIRNEVRLKSQASPPPIFKQEVVLLEQSRAITYRSKCAGVHLAKPWLDAALEVINREVERPKQQ